MYNNHYFESGQYSTASVAAGYGFSRVLAGVHLLLIFIDSCYQIAHSPLPFSPPTHPIDLWVYVEGQLYYCHHPTSKYHS